jgi:hypothetical protein
MERIEVNLDKNKRSEASHSHVNQARLENCY